MADYAADRRLAVRQRARARESTYLRNVDWVLLAAVGGIIAYGLWVISGITKDDVHGNPNYYVVRQAAYALVGCAGILVATNARADDDLSGQARGEPQNSVGATGGGSTPPLATRLASSRRPRRSMALGGAKSSRLLLKSA